MAAFAGRLVVGVAAVRVKAAETDNFQGERVIVFNRTAASIFLGTDNTVTITTGVELLQNDRLEVFLEPAEDLWAIAAAAGGRLDVIRFGV